MGRSLRLVQTGSCDSGTQRKVTCKQPAGILALSQKVVEGASYCGTQQVVSLTTFVSTWQGEALHSRIGIKERLTNA